MSEREQKILETITNAIPTMSEFEKGYLLGMGESISKKNENSSTEGEKHA